MHIPFLTTCQVNERIFKAFLSKSHRKECAVIKYTFYSMSHT